MSVCIRLFRCQCQCARLPVTFFDVGNITTVDNRITECTSLESPVFGTRFDLFSVRSTSIVGNTIGDGTSSVFGISAITGDELFVVDNVFSGNTDGNGNPLGIDDLVSSVNVSDVTVAGNTT